MRYSIVGTQHRKSDDFLRAQPVGTPATLIREPTNKFDPNAIQVWIGGQLVGYIPKATNKELAARIDREGATYPGPSPTVIDLGIAQDQAPIRSIEARYVISPNSAFPQVEVSDV